MKRTKTKKGQKGKREEESTAQPTIKPDPERSRMEEHDDKKTQPGTIIGHVDLLNFKREMQKTRTDFQTYLEKT